MSHQVFPNRWAAIHLAIMGICLATIRVSAWARVTELVSLSTTGEHGNNISGGPSITPDGRFIAFNSFASNLVPGDMNGQGDVFVRDRLAGTTELVSVSSGGTQGNNESAHATISADGRFVAFQSLANNLVAGDTNVGWDIFVRDRLQGTTTRVSVSTDGAQADASSIHAAISADGRFVVFSSDATNLVAGDTNGSGDVFLRDLSAATTQRVSISTTGGDGNSWSGWPSVSADGRFVAFESDASNLVVGDSNLARDGFIRDRLTSTTKRVSLSGTGQEGNGDSIHPWVSRDGRFVVFASESNNLVPGDTNGLRDVFIRDTLSDTTELVSIGASAVLGNDASSRPYVTAGGRLVAFESWASNLVLGDTNGCRDVLIRDRLFGITERVSVSSIGEEGDQESEWASISDDGTLIAFWSSASNLVAGDTNGTSDVFLRDRRPSAPGLLVNAGAACTNWVAVTLSLTCGECSEVRLRNDPGAWGLWEPCAATRPWMLPSGDGTKRVCVQGRDSLMNESSEVCDEILLHTTLPTVSALVINGGAECIDSLDVVLTVNAPGASQMRFRNELGAWSAWQSYYYTRAWTLSAGRGLKTVGFQARDACGNTSGEATGNIIAPTFDDVGCGGCQLSYVEALAREGITSGCSAAPPLYCPNSSITRAQMAVFIIRAMHETPYSKPTPTFTDVPASHSGYGYIERMYALGITGGCSTSPMRYCPDSPVTRSQMAVFLCRAAGKLPLNKATPTFSDVPSSASYYGYVERLADKASWGGAPVTSGCATNPLRYCPGSPVTRGQMAVFIVRAFVIPPAVQLVSPLQGAVLDNGRSDRQDYIVWDFDWADCPGATHYHLYVKGPTALNPVIDRSDLTASGFHHESLGSYVADVNRLGWTWKVRAGVRGVWGPWSDTRTFDVEPVDTDPPPQ